MPYRRSGRGEVVLVVEDDPVVQKLTKDFLDSLGYRSICADNGRDALDLIDAGTHLIQVILSDVVMPKMGGAELLDELRKRDAPIQVVLMSGYAPQRGLHTDSNHAPAAWLQKPFSVNDLAEVLSEVLEQAGE